MMEMSCIVDKKTGKQVCPLQNVEAKAVIDGNMAEVTLIQNYQNVGKGNIEALYTFPMPHNAQVTGFKAKIGDNEVVGEYKEKESAFKEYDNAVRQGDSGFLLESHRPDIFQISLGNIVSGEYISISITYIEDIKYIDNELRWVLPTVVAPRYIPGKASGKKLGMGTAAPTDKVPDADYITPPISDTSYTLTLKAEFKGARGIKKIASPSHPVEVLMDGNTYIVTLARETELLDSDFILTAMLENSDENSLYNAQLNDNEAFGVARLVVEIENVPADQKNYEYTFLIDVSGSMAGEKLDQAKRALGISLRNLVEGDGFNIVAFESSYHCFSNVIVPYTQENLEKADKWIDSLRDMGGTEIFEPLRYILEKTPNNEKIERVVLLFTDGQVGNENEIIKLVRKNNRSLNLFTFGIDTAVNKYFIDSLAEAGNGMPEYVYPGERIEDKVIRQFSRIHQPYISQLKVVGSDGAELETMPVLPSRLYSSEEYTFSICSDKLNKIDKLTINGDVNDEKIEFHIPLTGTGDARLLSLKWAKEKIRALEERMGSGNPRRDEIMKNEIIELSTKFGLLSTFTSLVAVYKRMNKEKGMLETIVVPVAKQRNWDMFSPVTNFVGAFASPAIVTENYLKTYSNSANKLEIPCFLRRKDKNMTRSKKYTQSDALSIPGIEDGIYDITNNNETSGNTKINDLIRKVAQKQNADGTFGSGNEINSKTAYFVIGMLLLEDEWKPYRIQIKKAGKALLGTGDEDILLKAIAINLLSELKVLAGSEVNAYMNEILSKIDEKQKTFLDAFRAGDYKILLKFIGGISASDEDRTEIISFLLKRVIE